MWRVVRQAEHKCRASILVRADHFHPQSRMKPRKTITAKALIVPVNLTTAKKAMRLMPSLSIDDVEVALSKAKKKIPEAAQLEFTTVIRTAFQNFLVLKMWELAYKPPPPAQTAKKLTAIAGAAARLAKALDSEQWSDARKPALVALTLAANAYGKKIGGYPRLPPKEYGPAPNRANSPRKSPLNYRGVEKLKDLTAGVALLHELAIAAAATEQAKADRRKTRLKAAGKHDKAVRGRDETVTRLYGDFAGAWMNAFSELPAISRRSDTGTPTGPSVRFLSFVFRALANRVSDELELLLPGLRQSLSPTEEAIANRINAIKTGRR